MVDDLSEIPRTLEPELMDSGQEVDEYRDMNHSSVNQAFVADLVSGGAVGPRVIDLGCGIAHIPVLLCDQLADVEVMGIDGSIEMLEAARIEVELGGATGRITLVHDDCKLLGSYDAEMAATVISNSLVHHVPDPKPVLEAAVHLVEPGGRVFIRDLSRPRNAEAVEQLVARHAAEESEFARQLLRQSLHAALTPQEMRLMLTEIGIPESCIRLTSDRHWTLDWTKPTEEPSE